MKRNYYISGDHNVTCDVCSRKIKMSQARKRWDGFLVCPMDYEERHPQDFVRAKQDKIYVRDTRPIPTLIYTQILNLYVEDGYADIGYIETEVI